MNNEFLDTQKTAILTSKDLVNYAISNVNNEIESLTKMINELDTILSISNSFISAINKAEIKDIELDNIYSFGLKRKSFLEDKLAFLNEANVILHNTLSKVTSNNDLDINNKVLFIIRVLSLSLPPLSVDFI